MNAAIDFYNMSSRELVAWYNNWEGVKPVKKFRDKKTGIKRCKELAEVLQQIKEGGHTDPEDLKIEEKPKVLSRRIVMSQSLALDRTIIVMDEAGQSLGMFANAHQMWKTTPKWVTGAQVDRLTRTLYAAAKQGIKKSVTINGRTFLLAQSGLRNE